MLSEAFTILAVLEATDKMSKTLEKVDKALGGFSETAQKAASSAIEAGARIDESLLQTASGADAVELADARLATAQEKLAASTKAQADAESALLEARASVASESELAAAADAVAAAQDRASVSAKSLADAQTALSAAQEAAAGEDELKVATDSVAAAQEKATLAAKELTAAQQQQAALVTSDDVAKAADGLAAAEKRASAATRDVSAAQDRQAATARAAALSTEEGRAAADEAAAAQEREALASQRAAAGAKLMGSALKWGALAVAAVGYESVKAAGNFESMTEHLVTDAGESQQNIGMIRSGMLALSVATGTTTTQMAAGMYHVESAGYHGAAALKVMQTAAEGAKVGGADLDTVSKALTGTMNAYGTSASGANATMNQLITAVGQGDMKMQDLASSLGNVAPAAAAAGISLSQVLGAVATMTAQNMSAQQATQDLNHTIGQLEKPSNAAVAEMQAMGLNANDVSKNLGKAGLTGTLDTLVSALSAHTKGGEVFISTLKNSQMAAANASMALKALPPSIQGAAQAWENGSLSTKAFNKELTGLPPAQQNLGHQFELLVKKSGSFNDLLKSGKPAAQTFNAALATMLGGSTGLNTALMLTGTHMASFKTSSDAVAEAAKKSGAHVDNWRQIQGTFNQKMDVAKASVEAMGISIGSMLLPVVSSIAGAVGSVLGPMAQWIAHNQKIIGLIGAILGPALAVVGIVKTISMVTKLWAAAQLLLDAAMEANPIGLLIAVLAAVVGGLIYAYTHFKTFRDIVNDVGKFVAAVFVGLWHALEIAFKAIVGAAVTTGHALETAWNSVVSAARTVWKFLTGIWNDIVNVTMTVWNSITGFFEKWWPLLLVIFAAPIAILIAAWNHFHQAIFDAAKTVWNAISGFFVTIWNFLKSGAETDWNLIMEYIVRPIEAAWHFLVQVWNSISQAISSAVHWVMGYVMQAWNLIYQYIVWPMQQAWHMVTGIFGDIVHAITSAINGVLNWLGGIGSWFVSIGSDIVNGIISGIESAGSALFSTLGNLAKSALNAAKSFLGIGSPSKEFAEQVGQWIPHGIALGVTTHAAVAHKAVADLAAGLPSTLSTSVVGNVAGGFGAGLPALGAGGMAGNRMEVTIDLRGAVIANQAAMNQLATAVGKKITDQLPAGGVRIHA